MIMMSQSLADLYHVVESRVVMNEPPYPSDHFATFSIIRPKEESSLDINEIAFKEKDGDQKEEVKFLD